MASAAPLNDLPWRQQEPQELAAVSFQVSTQTGLMSHKLITYLDALIPSCHGPGGPPIVGEGTGSAAVVRGRTEAVWSALSQASIDFRATIYPRFMAVYGCLCRFILY